MQISLKLFPPMIEKDILFNREIERWAFILNVYMCVCVYVSYRPRPEKRITYNIESVRRQKKRWNGTLANTNEMTQDDCDREIKVVVVVVEAYGCEHVECAAFDARTELFECDSRVWVCMCWEIFVCQWVSVCVCVFTNLMCVWVYVFVWRWRWWHQPSIEYKDSLMWIVKQTRLSTHTHTHTHTLEC